MTRFGIAIAVGTSVLALVASPCWAVRPEVEQAERLFEALHYDRATEAFQQALALEGNRPEDLASIFLHLGILAGAENDEELAEEHFRRALQVDPTLSLPGRLPPKITRPFANAREFWRDARLELRHQVPERFIAGSPAALQFEVTNDRMHMVTGARLSVWLEDDDARRSYRQDGEGPFFFPIPVDLVEEVGTIRYRFELLGAASSVLDDMGPEDGESVSVVLPPRVEVSVESPPERRPLYRRWWFWTVIGIVIAGGAVGTAVGLTAGDDGVEFGSPEVRR